MLKPPEYLPPTPRDLEIFEATVPADHYLRRVHQLIDLDACRDRLAAVYHPTQGRPALEPILLLKLEFLQYHYNLSDREVIDQAHYNMAFRFFLDLSLTSPLPHPTSLTHFRQRLGPDRHQEVFDTLVAQARTQGLIKDRLRLKDATHLLANIAIPATIALVAQTRERLLAAAQPYDGPRVAAERQQAQNIRQATVALAGEERLLQRVAHLRSLVAWVDDLVQRPPAVEDAALAAALRGAHQVLADRDDPPHPDAKADRIVSLHDPEARTGKHGGWYTGYQLDVAIDADSELITALDVQPANADEAANAAVLLRHEEAVHGNDVQAVSLDGIGFRGDVLRELTDPKGLNLEVFVPPTPEPVTKWFDPEQFTLNAEGTALTCPAGQTTRQRERNSHDTGFKFRFDGKTCARCPLRTQCQGDRARSGGRTVIKNDYTAEYQAARAKAQTPAYEAVRREHPRIERKLGELVRWHGARRARYRGRARVRVQALLTGLVVNVKRMVRLLLSPAVGPGGAVVSASG